MSHLKKPSPHYRFARREAGLSIIELMVSITLGLMVITAVISVFVNASQARSELERTSRQIENGRYAVELLSDDLRLAGFYGELSAASLPALPGKLSDFDPCLTTTAQLRMAMPLHVQGYYKGTGVSANCPGANPKPNTNVLFVRRVKTCEAGVAGCEAAADNKVYLQVTRCSSEAVTPFVLGLRGVDPPFPLKVRDCVNPAGLREYMVHVYYISNDNGATPVAQPIPTLKRLELQPGNPPTWVNTPLVEGIEELSIEYGIDTNDDGSPDVYTMDPNTYGGCTDQACVDNWFRVVTVRFHVLARNLERSPNYTDEKTYRLGYDDIAASVVTVGPFPDGVRRHVYTSLVRLVNPSGRKEKPL